MTIYISKKIEDVDFLNFIREKSIGLCAISMISFKSTVFPIPEENEYEAVFFTSPRSVLFFLDKIDLAESIFIGAIGKSTASFIHQQGYSVDYTGIQSGKPKEVAETFKAAVGDKKVLFPQSSRSKKSVQQYLTPEQCIDLVVYETLLEPQELKNQPEILVFTSPSNVESFLKKNTIDKSQQIVAWGDSTALYLEEKGCSSIKTLEKSNLEELRTVLDKILN
jgi:uroporphyrinogen-III synthase